MAIKGLVGKEGNTLGTPEQPWSAIYANGMFPAEPDLENSITIPYTSVKSGSIYITTTDVFEENGYVLIRPVMSSTSYFTARLLKEETILTILTLFGSSNYSFVTPVWKGWKVRIDTRVALTSSSSYFTFYKLLK